MKNSVTLIGRLGKDPEVRHLENGTPVANFSIATTESYKDKLGNKVEKTEWHNIVMWRGLAEVAEKYLKKGSLVNIEGKIQSREWTDNDNVTRRAYEILADGLVMLGDSNQQQ